MHTYPLIVLSNIKRLDRDVQTTHILQRLQSVPQPGVGESAQETYRISALAPRDAVAMDRPDNACRAKMLKPMNTRVPHMSNQHTHVLAALL